MAFLKNISEGADETGDDQLLAAYRDSSDLNILARLYQRYIELIYGVCLKYLGEAESARDAVMDIFEELVRKLPRHEVTYFRGWLYTLAKNHCLMKLRAAGRLKLSAVDPEHVQTADELHLNGMMEKEEQLDKLAQCMETLSAEQKTIVQLFYLQHKCYKEIGEITGLEWKQVRSHIQNGRRNLKICMDKQEIKIKTVIK